MAVVLRHSRQDPLTGVGNRLRLAEDIAALCGRVARYGHAYCVALLEVDGFQSLGREAGDDLLRRVAEALSATIRSGDTLYRYGGEQFLVLLPEQGLDGAALAGERLRAAIEVLTVEHPEAGTVTVSAGVAGLGSVSCSPEELFELAGRALERARDAGGNRVEVEEAGEPDRGDRAVRLLIAGEDETARSALTALAQRDAALDLVGAAAGAEQAVQLAGQRRPDVVLLDFDMPAGAGVRAAIDIREALPGVRIVAISADDSQAAQLDMSRAGAVGFLLKGAADDDEIVRVIRSAFRY
jgi:diguanylate cyclase (GGDEF)-like protein